MRDLNSAVSGNDSYSEMKSPYPIRFTGDAINHISAHPIQLKLEDWEWHEEVINGQTHCVITNRRLAQTPAAVVL